MIEEVLSGTAKDHVDVQEAWLERHTRRTIAIALQ
jgi:hypothetical protein